MDLLKELHAHVLLGKEEFLSFFYKYIFIFISVLGNRQAANTCLLCCML